MTALKILVLGGVAAGPAAAAKARRMNEQAEITLLEKGQHISYGTCGLPYYLSRVIPHEEDLLIQTPEAFLSRHNVQVRLGTEVLEVLPDQKKVIALQNGQRVEFVYDQLIYALGATPIIPPFAKEKFSNLFTLRNWIDL
jgi:NADPH-dependent 2,4-dienoyl-CoA reductase/sulfur reductase-like enzyme